MLKKVLIHEDEALIKRCLNNEATAESLLYNKYAHNMLHVAYRILNDKVLAKDVVQEAFIKAFSKLEKLDHLERFPGWIKRIVVNTAVNQLKQRKVFEEIDDQILKIQDQPELLQDDQFSIDIIRAALMQLASGYRTVISLYLIEGYDHEEIAEILKISKATSLSQYSRGKNKLKAIVQKMMKDGTH